MASSTRDLPEERLPSATDVCKGKCDKVKKNEKTAPCFCKNTLAIIFFGEEKERAERKLSQKTTAKGEILSSSSFRNAQNAVLNLRRSWPFFRSK